MCCATFPPRRSASYQQTKTHPRKVWSTSTRKSTFVIQGLSPAWEAVSARTRPPLLAMAKKQKAAAATAAGGDAGSDGSWVPPRAADVVVRGRDLRRHRCRLPVAVIAAAISGQRQEALMLPRRARHKQPPMIPSCCRSSSVATGPWLRAGRRRRRKEAAEDGARRAIAIAPAARVLPRARPAGHDCGQHFDHAC